MCRKNTSNKSIRVCINHNTEFGQVESCLNTQRIAVVVSRRRKSGLTIFLERVQFGLKYDDVFFIPSTTHSDVPAFLAGRIIENKRNTLAGKIISKFEYVAPIVSLPSVSIESIGLGAGFTVRGALETAISQSFSIPEDVKKWNQRYDSIYGEFVIRQFEKHRNRKRKILIITDDAQLLSEGSKKFLTDLYSRFCNISIVYGVNGYDNYNDVIGEYPSEVLSSVTSNCISIYSKPEIVKLLFRAHNIEKTDTQCQEILLKFNFNMLKIAYAAKGLDCDILFKDLSEIQRDVLLHIAISKVALRCEDINNILSNMHVAIPKALDELFSKKYLIERNQLIYINEKNDDANYIVTKLQSQHALATIASSRVFDYFFDKQIEILTDEQLEYVIFDAKENYRDPIRINKMLYDLLKRKLIKSLPISTRLLDAFKLYDNSDRVLFAYVNYFRRDYRVARTSLLEIPKKFKNHWNYRILDILLLIRERRYSNALSELESIVSKVEHSSQAAALYANMKAQCLLHSNQMVKFDEFCNTNIPIALLNQTSQYGYFLNVIAAHQPQNRTIELLEQAKRLLATDSFGLCLSRVNKLTHLIVQGELTESNLIELNNILVQMKQFGEDHLHIIYNTLGLFYLFRSMNLDDLEKAEQNFKLANKYHHNGSMPKVFINTNLAFVALFKGHYSDAQFLLNEIENIALNPQEVDRIRQKYYINRALIEKICKMKYNYNGLNDETYYYNLARQHPDRRNPTIVDDTIQLIETIDHESQFSEIKHIISPCYLEYWYFNPSNLIDWSTM